MGLSRSKSQKFRIFGKTAPKGRIPLSDSTILSVERESQVHPLATKFHHRGFIMWAEVRQIHQNMDFFVINLPVRGQSA